MGQPQRADCRRADLSTAKKNLVLPVRYAGSAAALPVLGGCFVKLLRMTDTAASEAARALVAQRWGGQRPARLARELLPRLDELPADERSRLLAALRDTSQSA